MMLVRATYGKTRTIARSVATVFFLMVGFLLLFFVTSSRLPRVTQDLGLINAVHADAPSSGAGGDGGGDSGDSGSGGDSGGGGGGADSGGSGSDSSDGGCDSGGDGCDGGSDSGGSDCGCDCM